MDYKIVWRSSRYFVLREKGPPLRRPFYSVYDPAWVEHCGGWPHFFSHSRRKAVRWAKTAERGMA